MPYYVKKAYICKLKLFQKMEEIQLGGSCDIMQSFYPFFMRIRWKVTK